MKTQKILAWAALLPLLWSNVLAYSKEDLNKMFLKETSGQSMYLEAANYLASEWIIVDRRSDPKLFHINSKLLRQEMAWIVRVASWLSKKNFCEWVFRDVSATKPNTWACSSIEALYDAWFIAKNKNYRPEDTVSKAEALGFIIWALFKEEYKKAYDNSKSWEKNVISFAQKAKLLREPIWDYRKPATRGFIFSVAYYSTLVRELNELTQGWSQNSSNPEKETVVVIKSDEEKEKELEEAKKKAEEEKKKAEEAKKKAEEAKKKAEEEAKKSEEAKKKAEEEKKKLEDEKLKLYVENMGDFIKDAKKYDNDHYLYCIETSNCPVNDKYEQYKKYIEDFNNTYSSVVCHTDTACNFNEVAIYINDKKQEIAKRKIYEDKQANSAKAIKDFNKKNYVQCSSDTQCSVNEDYNMFEKYISEYDNDSNSSTVCGNSTDCPFEEVSLAMAQEKATKAERTLYKGKMDSFITNVENEISNNSTIANLCTSDSCSNYKDYKKYEALIKDWEEIYNVNNSTIVTKCKDSSSCPFQKVDKFLDKPNPKSYFGK